MKIAEYMPRKLLFATMAARIILIGLMVLIVWLFGVGMNRLEIKKYRYAQYELQLAGYEENMKEGQRYFTEEDYEKCEVCYRRAIAAFPQREEPYLELAKVFVHIKEYEAAREILLSYPDENREAIQSMTDAVQENITVLEQSVMSPL